MTGRDEIEALKAALAWQAELGADAPIGDVPVDRFAESRAEAHRRGAEGAARRGNPPSAASPAASVASQGASSAAAGPGRETASSQQAAHVVCAPEEDPLEKAKRLAAAADSLEALRAAIEAFDGFEIRKGARNLVFADGNPVARVMIVGEAPGRDEDRIGRPFVGRAGQLLDRMFAAIGLARDAEDPARALYITNVLNWRPPQNREPTPEEIALALPFLARHVALVDPAVLVLMGNTALAALLGRKGITRLRGHWQQIDLPGVGTKPALPMFHPAYLLRNPHAKREAWADLLELKAWLIEHGLLPPEPPGETPSPAPDS